MPGRSRQGLARHAPTRRLQVGDSGDAPSDLNRADGVHEHVEGLDGHETLDEITRNDYVSGGRAVRVLGQP